MQSVASTFAAGAPVAAKPQQRAAQAARAAVMVRAQKQEAAVDRRAALAAFSAAAAAVAAAKPAEAAYGDAARVFAGNITNKSGFVPYAGEGFAVLIPSKWNPSREQDFPGVVLRYEDNGDAVNNMVVLVQKVGKNSIEDLGSPDKFLQDNAYLFGESASFVGQTQSEGGFAPNKVSAASVLDVAEATDKKGKKYYKFEVLARAADGDEGGRHQLITAAVANGNLYLLKVQIGDKRWFKGAKNDAMGTWNSFTVATPRRSSLLTVQLAPGGVLTSDVIARATGTSGAGDEGYHAVNRVAYQGVPGAYSEMAAIKACPGWEPLPCEQFETAFQALSQWMAERAALPVENSLGGSIHAVYDLLLRYRLHIVGEVSIAVRHCLLALPGVEKGDIRRVLSHPQALAQTDAYTRRMQGVVREAVDDTAGAAKMIADNDWRDAAAVASRRAGELYGLDVLDEDIQDMKDNVTRFVVLSRDPLMATDALTSAVPYKTSIVFSLQEGPGMLFKALSVFALRDIDMTKIESRPMRANPLILSDASSGGPQQRSFNYLFYIDFVGSLADPQAQNALRHLQEIAPFLRVLGSYPMDTTL